MRPIFVPGDPIMISVVSRGAVRGQLVVDLVYGVSDSAAMGEVKAKKPHLHDSGLRVLSGYASGNMDPRRPVDTGMISMLMQRSADQILGPGIVKVYLKAANFYKL